MTFLHDGQEVLCGFLFQLYQFIVLFMNSEGRICCLAEMCFLGVNVGRSFFFRRQLMFRGDCPRGGGDVFDGMAGDEIMNMIRGRHFSVEKILMC